MERAQFPCGAPAYSGALLCGSSRVALPALSASIPRSLPLHPKALPKIQRGALQPIATLFAAWHAQGLRHVHARTMVLRAMCACVRARVCVCVYSSGFNTANTVAAAAPLAAADTFRLEDSLQFVRAADSPIIG